MVLCFKILGFAPEVSLVNDSHKKGKQTILSLAGGLEHCLFFHILGIIIPTD
jgi:hypothetical protein